MFPGDSFSETVPAVLMVFEMDMETGSKPTSSAQCSVEIRGETHSQGDWERRAKGRSPLPSILMHTSEHTRHQPSRSPQVKQVC